MKPLITVSLLLFSSEKFVRNCLESLFAQTYDNFEFLLADNNDSPDEGVTIAREFIEKYKEKHKVEFVSYGKNIGFAAGHNRAIAGAKGEYVLLLNQDVILAEDFLEKALAVLEKDKKLCGVQSRCLRLKEIDGRFQKTNIIDNFGLVMLKNRRIIARGQGQTSTGKFLKEEEIFGIDGAVPLFRKSALEDAKICLDGKCEYLDEDFLSYKEDVDLAWRLRLLGWRAIYAPQAVAWHARGSGDSAVTGYIGIIKERLKINRFAKYLAFKNQRLMQIKNERIGILLKHLLWFLPKEIGAWGYVVLFEYFTWRAIVELFKQAPRAWQKRKIIMARKKVSEEEIGKWFK